mmetsp:Transcript_13253/g.15859  ORF Transcript_13253/g.15859 Transcript_13253/m.15859 type:complete len:87 (-) Transcript_13253:689-949(-)
MGRIGFLKASLAPNGSVGLKFIDFDERIRALSLRVFADKNSLGDRLTALDTAIATIQTDVEQLKTDYTTQETKLDAFVAGGGIASI